MGILDNAKQVAKAVEEIHNLELYQRVISLHSDIIELVEQNNGLRDENKELKRNRRAYKSYDFPAAILLSRRRSNAVLSRLLGRKP
jgi:regulator of replication initiation timing